MPTLSAEVNVTPLYGADDEPSGRHWFFWSAREPSNQRLWFIKPQKSFLIDMFDIIKKYSAEPIIDYFYYNKDIYNQINTEYGFSIDATKRLMQSHEIVNNVNE